MEFDINLVFVPITLIFLMIWLVDVAYLKRHRAVVRHEKALRLANQAMQEKERAFKSICDDHKIASHAELSSSHIEPTEIRLAHQDLVTARQAYAKLKAEQQAVSEPVLVRWAYEFLPILVFLVVLRSFVGEVYNIPSSSMVPTLYTGDFIVVNKWAYGLRLPIIHSKILNTSTPKNGDVVVFRYPNNEKLYYIKRVIGVPGDTVAFSNDRLTINGVAIETTPSNVGMDMAFLDNLYPKKINEHTLSDDERLSLATTEEGHAHYYSEKLGTHQYQVRYLGDLNVAQYAPFLQENSGELTTSNGRAWRIVIPEGKYFMMGDNRDRSEDGRFWGFVDDSQLGGRATHVLFHKKPGLALPSFDRTGKID